MNWPELPPNPYLNFQSRDCVRVRGTRIDLTHIVEWYQAGLSPERMVADYPPLTLETVYNVLAYYLSQKQAVDQYIACWNDQAERHYQEYLQQPESPVVTRLKALKAAKKSA